MAKRKETVTVRAFGVVDEVTGRVFEVGTFGRRGVCGEKKQVYACLLKKRQTIDEVVVPCTITYTKPGGKNGK